MVSFAVLEVMTTADTALSAWREARSEGDPAPTLSSPEVSDALRHLTLHQTILHIPQFLPCHRPVEA